MTGRRPLPRALPAPPGKCYLCRTDLLDPRDASVMQIRGGYRLICRSAIACQAQRRLAKERKENRA
jgi:hypothetical protein